MKARRSCIICLLKPIRYLAPFTSQSTIQVFFTWGLALPNLGNIVEIGGRMWYPVKPALLSRICLLTARSYLSLRFTNWTRCELLSWWTRSPLPSQLAEGAELGGTKWSHSNLYYLVSSNSDQSAISNCLAQHSIVTDRRTDIISIAIADLDTVR
jgi:hypothetical protein